MWFKHGCNPENISDEGDILRVDDPPRSDEKINKAGAEGVTPEGTEGVNVS